MIHSSVWRVSAVVALGGAVAFLAETTTHGQAYNQKWIAAWAASAQGPYPSGNASAQPVLDFAFESPQAGATDQTLRLIVKPDLWGRVIRLRFANTFGNRAITFDEVFVGVQGTGAALIPRTNTRVTFDRGKVQLDLARGASVWSDPVTLPFVSGSGDRLLAGRKLAVSFHVGEPTGPMTWHAKALTTSYLTPPHAGRHAGDDDDGAFPFTTTSWFFLDALDVMAPADTAVIACFGDSITDGTASTLNGDDRWPDALSRRLHAAYGAVSGRQCRDWRPGRRPSAYSAETPVAGGPSALDRLDRDVLSLSGLSAVIWLEGINDLAEGTSAEAVIAAMREGIRRIRARGDIAVVGATLTSSLGSTTAHGTADADARRQSINTFIRTSGVFSAVADFDAATRDDRSGGLRDAFVPNSTIGGPGDHLHPNRAGYQAMANAIDIGMFAPRTAASTPRR